jgi:uncharacterized membrane protein YkvA (DUF1232 family)
MKRDHSTLKAVVIGIIAVLYGASPIDIIPDVLGPIGWADDALALLGAGYAIWRILKGRADRRARSGTMEP